MFSYLTDGQLTAAMALIALSGGTFGYLAKRWLSQTRAHEGAALLNSLADLRAKMKSDGVDLHQIAELERMVRGQGILSAESAEAVLGGEQLDSARGDNLPNSYYTSVAMQMRAGARFDAVDAQLEEALTELSTLISELEQLELDKSNVAWKVYRKRQMSYAAKRFHGGTLAPLAGTFHGIEVTERRIVELKNEIEIRKSDPH